MSIRYHHRFGWLVLLFLAGCYPLTTGSGQWKIRFDRDEVQQKEAYLAEVERSRAGRPPNVILILADDLGLYEVSAYGATHIQTPHIDALGERGVRFREGYVTAPICSPSRAALMTGRYQHRFGYENQPMEYYPSNLIEYYSGKYLIDTDEMIVSTRPRYPAEWNIARQGLPPAEITLAELLKKYGYQTAITGKWHLGHGKWHLPRNRGFDYSYGFYAAHTLYTQHREEPGYVNYRHEHFSARYQWKRGRKETSAIRRNGKTIKEERYLTFAIRDEAIDFIEAHREEPFFLYIPFSAPHIPFQAPQAYYDRFPGVEDENKRVYYAMIAAMDDAIGAISRRVDELGLAEETLIIFLSDNGGATYTGATDNGPLKGGKMTTFEGGINVPFLMQWEGRIPAGKVYDPPVSSLDIFATVAAAAGIDLPADRPYDGVNLLPYVAGLRGGPPHEALFWKAEHIQSMRKGQWKFLRSTRDQWVHLYDLGRDKCETYDLHQAKPEVLESMLREYYQWQQEMETPRWPRVMDHRFEIDGMTYLFPS